MVTEINLSDALSVARGGKARGEFGAGQSFVVVLNLRDICGKLISGPQKQKNEKNLKEKPNAEHFALDRHRYFDFDGMGRCQKIPGQHGFAAGRTGTQHSGCCRRFDDISAQECGAYGIRWV